MKSRALIYTLLMIAIFALLFLFLVFGMSPPDTQNETIIRSGNTDWSLDNNPKFYGRTVWARFSDYVANSTLQNTDTIKVENAMFLGSILYDTEAMSWEVENGSYSFNSLTFDDLMGRWQNSESIFILKQGDNLFKVTFTIPKLQDGTSKYSSLLEAWEEGELYQIVEG